MRTFPHIINPDRTEDQLPDIENATMTLETKGTLAETGVIADPAPAVLFDATGKPVPLDGADTGEPDAGEPATDGEVVVKGKGKRHDTTGFRALSQKRTDTCNFYAGQLDVDDSEFNIRDWTDPDNLAEIDRIAETILGTDDTPGGVHDAIQFVFRDGKLKVAAGLTRVRAVLKLEGREYAPGMRVKARVEPDSILIPAVPAPANRNDDTRLVDLLVSTGRPYKDIELAPKFAKLEARGWTQLKIAAAMGRPGQQTWVSQILSLNKASSDVQTYVRRGIVKPSTVVSAFHHYGADKANEVIIGLVEDKIKAQRADDTGDGLVVPEPKRPTPPPSGRSRTTAPVVNRGAMRGSSKRQSASSARSTEVRVTGREIAAKAGDPDKAAYTKAHFDIAVQAIRYEAGYSTSEQTRNNMNETLARLELEPEPCRVDKDGNELPVEKDATA